MSEDEIFEKFKEIDPDFGKGNRLVKDKNNRFNFPKWTGISPKRKMVNLKIDSILLTSQLIYDIFILGITDSSQRPKCPICGKSCKYSSINDGYSKTCGSVDCCKKSISNTVYKLWSDNDYRKQQSDSHKEWASKEENIEYMRQRSLNTWKSEGYRERQSNVHKEWASKEENIEKLRQRTLKVWQDENYRKRQSEVHKEWVKNNPDKVRCYNSSHGKVS